MATQPELTASTWVAERASWPAVDAARSPQKACCAAFANAPVPSVFNVSLREIDLMDLGIANAETGSLYPCAHSFVVTGDAEIDPPVDRIGTDLENCGARATEERYVARHARFGKSAVQPRQLRPIHHAINCAESVFAALDLAGDAPKTPPDGRLVDLAVGRRAERLSELGSQELTTTAGSDATRR